MPPKKRAKRGQDQAQSNAPGLESRKAAKVPAIPEPKEEWEIPLQQMSNFIPQEVTLYVTRARVSHLNGQTTTSYMADDSNQIKTRDDWHRRMQVAFACLFHRCQYFSEEMLNEIIETLRPTTLPVAFTDYQDINLLVLKLYQTIAQSHIKLTGLFLNNTDQGRDYVRSVTKLQAQKSKIPDVDYKVLAAAMPLEPQLIRMLWFPLRAVAREDVWKDDDEDRHDENTSQAFIGTEVVQRFCQWTIAFIAALSRILSSRKTQLSVYAQITIFRELSKPRQPAQWPNFDLDERRIRQIKDGNYLNVSTKEHIDGSLEELKQRLTQHLRNNKEPSAGGEPHKPTPGTSDATEADAIMSLEEIEEEPFGPISIDARPINWGSEYRETGGTGTDADAMETVHDCNRSAMAEITKVLEGGLQELTERTGTATGTGQIPEELVEVSTLGPRALVRYAALQMEREGDIIVRIICELEEILVKNKAERDALAAQIHRQRKLGERMKGLESTVRKEQAAKETDVKELEDLLAVNNKTKVPKKSGGSWLDRVGNLNRKKPGDPSLGNLGWKPDTPIPKDDDAGYKQLGLTTSNSPQRSSQKPTSDTPELQKLTVDTSPSSPKDLVQQSPMSSQLSSPTGTEPEDDDQFSDNDDNNGKVGTEDTA
jgi:hypothetical protein